MSSSLHTTPDPVPPYDLACMPPEERILALIDFWVHGNFDAALERFHSFGLPPVAMQDMIMELDYAYRHHFSLPENRARNKPRHRWNIVAVVLARGGSKGLPGKALRTFRGVPLIVHAVRKCQAIGDVKRIIVNTDSPEIAAVARQAGAETPFLRPAELATDTASSTHAALFGRLWLSLIERYLFDFHVVVSATHPLFDTAELNRALDAMAAAEATTLETVATLPTYNTEFYSLEGHTLTSLPLPMLPAGQAMYAQSGAFSITGQGPYYHLHGIYLAKTRTRVPRRTAMAWILPADRCVDIDHREDLYLAEQVPDASGGCNQAAASSQASTMQRACAQTSPPLEDTLVSGTASLTFVRVLWISSDKEPQVLDGVPVPLQVLHTLAAVGQGPLFVAGPGLSAKTVAGRFGLPWFEVAASAHPCHEVFCRLRQGLTQHGTYGPMLVVDARAAALTQGSIASFAALVADRPRTAACSVSRPPVHPAHLKRIGENGPVAVCSMSGSRRQDLPPVWCRDGVLTWLPAEGDCISFTHGMDLGQTEAFLVDTAFDRMRLATLSTHRV